MENVKYSIRLEDVHGNTMTTDCSTNDLGKAIEHIITFGWMLGVREIQNMQLRRKEVEEWEK